MEKQLACIRRLVLMRKVTGARCDIWIGVFDDVGSGAEDAMKG